MTKYRIIYQNSSIEAPEGTFDIGRSLDCNLVLDDPSVSRVHATLTRIDEDLFIEDRGSRNGCSVNGTPVTGRVRLKDGDEVKIGHQMIRVAAVKQEIKVSAAAKNTMGLVACPHCRHWMSMDDHICPSCGRSRDLTSRTAPPRIDVADSAEDPENDTRLPNVHSGQMISGLARKALSLNRSDEALKLTASLIESAIKKESTGESKEEDLEAIVELLVEIGIATQAPERISDIFSFFNTIRRLIPRKSVDLLYNSVRRTGYRSCPEMHRYLTTLGELSRKFSPGEKFIHRRIEGLVGLCS